MQLDVRVRAERQTNVTVPGKCLGHLGRNAGAFQAGDEQVPRAVEIGVHKYRRLRGSGGESRRLHCVHVNKRRMDKNFSVVLP
jgi:hypothetical protein